MTTDQPPVKKEVELRARKQEKIYLYWALISTGVLVILLLVGVLHFNAGIVIGAGIILLILALVVLREKPVPDMWDTWEVIRGRERKMTHTRLPKKPARMQAEPHGQYLVFQARVDDGEGPMLFSYLWQEVPGRVWGRRPRYIDDIKREMDRSKISTAVATQSLMRYERNRLLEVAGFEPDEQEGTQ